MKATYALRDLAIAVGASISEELAIPLEPYRQGGFSYGTSDGSVHARLDITAMTNGWSLRLRSAADLHGPCSRCLEDAVLHVEIDSHEVHDADAEDPELQSDFINPDEQLDLAAWLQDAVGVEFPTRVLCQDDCRGLCPSCGTEWNRDTCSCSAVQVDSRWEKLRELKLDGTEE
jgi:uncharacterized protein